MCSKVFIFVEWHRMSMKAWSPSFVWIEDLVKSQESVREGTLCRPSPGLGPSWASCLPSSSSQSWEAELCISQTRKNTIQSVGLRSPLSERSLVTSSETEATRDVMWGRETNMCVGRESESANSINRYDIFSVKCFWSILANLEWWLMLRKFSLFVYYNVLIC